MYARILDLKDSRNDSVFLWGARQTGKSTLLASLFPHEKYYDLLKGEIFERLNRRPSLLREEVMALPEQSLVIIDEVQKIPQLLDEVHWLITNRSIRFILSGSSARKLKRTGSNLLGGRAVRNLLFPLVSHEIPDFTLDRAINNGMLPRHYMVDDPWKRIQAYVGDYLQEEIRAEGLSRNLATFGRFLEVAALSCGEELNFNNIARECGISGPTVKEYFTILEDTLIGFMLPAYRKSMKRRLIKAPRFYYMDVGLNNFLLNRRNLLPGSPEYGKAFEHFLMQEIRAWNHYLGNEEEMSYWRTSSGSEVDLIMGPGRVAIEFKSSREIHAHHLKGLKAFSEEHPHCRLIVVSLEESKRLHYNIEIFPVHDFLSELWNMRLF